MCMWCKKKRFFNNSYFKSILHFRSREFISQTDYEKQFKIEEKRMKIIQKNVTFYYLLYLDWFYLIYERQSKNQFEFVKMNTLLLHYNLQN